MFNQYVVGSQSISRGWKNFQSFTIRIRQSIELPLSWSGWWNTSPNCCFCFVICLDTILIRGANRSYVSLSAHLRNIRQNGFTFLKKGVKIKNVWNHLDILYILYYFWKLKNSPSTTLGPKKMKKSSWNQHQPRLFSLWSHKNVHIFQWLFLVPLKGGR